MTGFVSVTCYRCKVATGMPQAFYEIAKQRGKEMGWFCLNGHEQIFATGPTEEEKLRKQLETQKQQNAYEADQRRRADERREQAERTAAAYKGQATKLRKRISGGACPCCNRSFPNLTAHMKTKHPDFAKEEA